MFLHCKVGYQNLPLTQSPCQVQASKKVISKANKEKTEKIEPKTYREKVAAQMTDWLQAAAKARTHSITLGSLEFAEELAKKLLAHAVKMEKDYLKISAALKDKATKERHFQNYLTNMEDMLKGHQKLQARSIHHSLD